MSRFTYDVGYEETRNRTTVAFRIILAIPHLIVAQVWGYLAQILAVIQWFIIVFTGKRNEGIWKLQQSYMYYYCRVIGYVTLLYDQYPAFGTDPGPVPVRSEISFEESADRLTSGLRLIWAIPAVIIAAVVAIGAYVVVIISWFAIVITGKQSRGMWDFILKVLRFSFQLESYVLLLTDTYPKFGEGASTHARSGSSPPPPPGSFVHRPPAARLTADHRGGRVSSCSTRSTSTSPTKSSPSSPWRPNHTIRWPTTRCRSGRSKLSGEWSRRRLRWYMLARRHRSVPRRFCDVAVACGDLDGHRWYTGAVRLQHACGLYAAITNGCRPAVARSSTGCRRRDRMRSPARRADRADS